MENQLGQLALEQAKTFGGNWKFNQKLTLKINMI